MEYPTRVAFSGSEALTVAQEFRPDVVFLDIGLPGMNGYEVAREMRTRGFNTTYIVALTGWGADDDRRRAQEAGFNQYITKPVEADQVEGLLKELARLCH
jgi:CheY-like chemotaxis protein